MHVLGFEFALPRGFYVQSTTSNEGGRCVELSGKNALEFAESIAKTLVSAGFTMQERGDDRIALARGQQRLVLAFDSTGLTVQTYDPVGLPIARHEANAILVGDLRVECGPVSITPLYEKHSGGSSLRTATWRLRGASAADIVDRVLDAAVAGKGLKRGVVFGPPKGGIESWVGEAYSDVELVKATATVDSGEIRLEVDIVDKRAGETDPG